MIMVDKQDTVTRGGYAEFWVTVGDIIMKLRGIYSQ